MPLVSCVGASFGALGGSWGHLRGQKSLRCLCEFAVDTWGTSGRPLGCSGGSLGVSWGRLGDLLGCLGATLEGSCIVLERREDEKAEFPTFFERHCLSLGRLGAVVALFWLVLGASGADLAGRVRIFFGSR